MGPRLQRGHVRGGRRAGAGPWLGVRGLTGRRRRRGGGAGRTRGARGVVVQNGRRRRWAGWRCPNGHRSPRRRPAQARRCGRSPGPGPGAGPGHSRPLLPGRDNRKTPALRERSCTFPILGQACHCLPAFFFARRSVCVPCICVSQEGVSSSREAMIPDYKSECPFRYFHNKKVSDD